MGFVFFGGSRFLGFLLFFGMFTVDNLPLSLKIIRPLLIIIGLYLFSVVTNNNIPFLCFFVLCIICVY